MNNSLTEVHTELVSEWSEKNLTLTPDDITFGSNKKVWWKGACGHEWQTTHTVELTYAGQNISVTETSTSFYNERRKVQVSLAKAIEKDKTFGIGDNGEIKNISFGLYAAEDIVSASGTVIPADGLIEIVSVNENGTAVMKSDLPFGKYYVKEIATDEHYVLSDTKYPVVFEYAGQDTATVEIKVNDGKEIKNELIYGSVSGKKIDEKHFMDEAMPKHISLASYGMQEKRDLHYLLLNGRRIEKR